MSTRQRQKPRTGCARPLGHHAARRTASLVRHLRGRPIRRKKCACACDESSWKQFFATKDPDAKSGVLTQITHNGGSSLRPGAQARRRPEDNQLPRLMSNPRFEARRKSIEAGARRTASARGARRHLSPRRHVHRARHLIRQVLQQISKTFFFSIGLPVVEGGNRDALLHFEALNIPEFPSRPRTTWTLLI